MGAHRLEFPHTFAKLACPQCGHRATRAPLVHPETGDHSEDGDQFHLAGYEFDHHADLVAALPDVFAHLFSQPPESIQIACPSCGHQAHGHQFGLAAHLDAAAEGAQ